MHQQHIQYCDDKLQLKQTKPNNLRVALPLLFLSVGKVLTGLDVYFQRTAFKAVTNGKFDFSGDISLVKIPHLGAGAVNTN